MHFTFVFHAIMAKKPIQVWIDAKRKKRVEKILERNGLDMASVLRMFVAQIDLRNSIPLNLSLENDHEASAKTEQFPWSEKEVEEAYRESLDPKNLSRPYNLPEEWDAFCKDLGLPK